MSPGAAAPILKDLLLLGGGHSHLAVLRHFAMRPVAGLRITLVSEVAHAAYSGMLPGLLSGAYRFDQAHIDLPRLCRAAGARFVRAQANALSCQNGRLGLSGRPDLRFDLLSVNIGSTPDPSGVPGASGRVLPVKPVAGLLERWQAWEASLPDKDRPISLGVVGAGAGGIEIALALHKRLEGYAEVTIRLVEAAAEILPGFPPRVQRRVSRSLESRGISVHRAQAVARVQEHGLLLDDGTALDLDQVIWATGAAAPDWLRETDLPLDDRGFVRVDHHLRAEGHNAVFAAGDIASMASATHPKSGVFAVRQGPVLAANLRRCLLGLALRPYRPQRRHLSLLSTADGSAIAARGAFCLEGPLAWRWKDWIDRRFMARYADLEVMGDAAGRPRSSLPGTAALRREADMRCRGCGAKLPGGELNRVLTRLQRRFPTTIADPPEDRDDAAVTRTPAYKDLVQSVDHLPALLSDPFTFGRIAATHCLGDLYAMGAEPWTALAIASVPFDSPEKRQEELFQLLAGAALALEQAGVQLIGGHSGTAEETQLGFAVNGLVEAGQALRKSGLRDGQALILTKPLGTGVLFAAEMRGRAKGRWLDDAVAAMLGSNREAAACLVRHGATAMTDVTGFGLAGHLLEMLTASVVDARLDLQAVPSLEGVRELLGQKLESSIAASNRDRSLPNLRRTADTSGETVGLLHDPQTSGGLLAGLPEDQAAACLTELHGLGDTHAAIIGRIESRRGAEAVLAL